MFFFFSDTATTKIYTLSLHDALPIWDHRRTPGHRLVRSDAHRHRQVGRRDRKSTRLNSSHGSTSYAVFCLKKKRNTAVSEIEVPVKRKLIEVALTVAQLSRANRAKKK